MEIYGLLNNVLRESVDEKGLVDFRKLGENKDFDKALILLKEFDLDNLKTKNEKLAFWINIYNVLAHKTSLDYVIPNKVSGIREIPKIGKNVWKQELYAVGGKKISLDEIEHVILRPMKEPRIHFSIVCSSMSCPPLRKEVYIPDKLEEQLTDQAKRFMQNPKYVEEGITGLIQTLYVSPILKWFVLDFWKAKGFWGVKHTIKKYTTQEIKEFMKKGLYNKLQYKLYNWDLNSQ